MEEREKYMPTKTIRQSVTFKAAPHAVYEALMNAKKHAAFTGDVAKISRKVGGKFSIFGGGLHGKNLELVADKKIVQVWRCEMKGWPKDHFSKATFAFSKIKGGAKLVFTQTGVPASCAKSIAQGWHDYYWVPMKQMLEG